MAIAKATSKNRRKKAMKNKSWHNAIKIQPI